MGLVMVCRRLRGLFRGFCGFIVFTNHSRCRKIPRTRMLSIVLVSLQQYRTDREWPKQQQCSIRSCSNLVCQQRDDHKDGGDLGEWNAGKLAKSLVVACTCSPRQIEQFGFESR